MAQQTLESEQAELSAPRVTDVNFGRSVGGPRWMRIKELYAAILGIRARRRLTRVDLGAKAKESYAGTGAAGGTTR